MSGEAVTLAAVPAWILYVMAAAWGGIWGSFATVIVWRFPRGESIVWPGSHCPACGAQIRWHDNIPVLGYALLGGRCRRCKGAISPLYPALELACVLVALAVFRRFHSPAVPAPVVLSAFFVFFLFFWALIVVTIVDLKTWLVPDIVTLPGIVVFLAYNVLVDRQGAPLAALAVAGSYLVVYLFFNRGYRLLTGAEGMGMGDAKLLAMIAAMTGWRGAAFALVAGALQGLLVNTPLIIARRRRRAAVPLSSEPGAADAEAAPAAGREKPATFLKTQVPFGPMLALGAAEFVLVGDRVIAYYFELADRVASLFAP